jgi:hypothetical protein
LPVGKNTREVYGGWSLLLLLWFFEMHKIGLILAHRVCGFLNCWRLKHVTTFDPQAYGPTHFSPRGDPQGSCQSAEQGDC